MAYDLKALADRAEIQDLLLRYARAVDGRDAAAMRACFADDAQLDYGYFAGDPATVVAAIVAGTARYERTMHFLGSPLIELAGGAARVETYALAHLRRTEGGQAVDLVQGLRYLDDVVRTPGGWRIARRVLRVDWERRDPVTPLGPPG